MDDIISFAIQNQLNFHDFFKFRYLLFSYYLKRYSEIEQQQKWLTVSFDIISFILSWNLPSKPTSFQLPLSQLEIDNIHVQVKLFTRFNYMPLNLHQTLLSPVCHLATKLN